MVQVRNVLCAVDFSDCSRRALDHALVLAKWYRSRLSVMYVYHVPLAEMAFSSLPAPASMEGLMLSPGDREQLRARLQALMPVDAAVAVPVDFVVAEGDIAGEILAQSASADLLVLGTHGQSGYEHLVLGSVAEKMVRKAQCPVLTVPGAAGDATEGVPGLFHHIVAAIDFSPASMQALTFAASLAEEADAHLTVLEVVEIPRELALWAEESQEGKDRVEQWKALARSRVRRVVPDALRVCCHADERIETGQPYREILRVAAEQHAGLIVLGACGHGAVGRMFFGSTAQHVVREAVCPVLTLRPTVHAPSGGVL